MGLIFLSPPVDMVTRNEQFSSLSPATAFSA